MAVHELKTWNEPFEQISHGNKTFEYRKNDRDFREGDTLLLMHWDEGVGAYCRVAGTPIGLPETIEVRVGYILRGGAFGVPDGYCVMSIEIEDTNLPELSLEALR